MALAPPVQICHTAGGRSGVAGKSSARVSTERVPHITGKRVRTTVLMSRRKDRRDEESQAKCKRRSEWCDMHPREQGSPSCDYELRYQPRIVLSYELVMRKAQKSVDDVTKRRKERRSVVTL